MEIYSGPGYIQQHSDAFLETNFIVFEPTKAKYYHYLDWTTCDIYGCQSVTSTDERDALEEFFRSTNGYFWRNNENWLDGDPCTNHWFGVTCNK